MFTVSILCSVSAKWYVIRCPRGHCRQVSLEAAENIIDYRRSNQLLPEIIRISEIIIRMRTIKI